MTLTCVDTGAVFPPIPLIVGENVSQFTCDNVPIRPYRFGEQVPVHVRFLSTLVGPTTNTLLRLAYGGGVAPDSIVLLDGEAVGAKLLHRRDGRNPSLAARRHKIRTQRTRVAPARQQVDLSIYAVQSAGNCMLPAHAERYKSPEGVRLDVAVDRCRCSRLRGADRRVL